MSLSIIAAVGAKRELGKKGGLCFNIPNDMKFFRKTTMGHPVFMGLSTWYSLPGRLKAATIMWPFLNTPSFRTSSPR